MQQCGCSQNCARHLKSQVLLPLVLWWEGSIWPRGGLQNTTSPYHTQLSLGNTILHGICLRCWLYSLQLCTQPTLWGVCQLCHAQPSQQTGHGGRCHPVIYLM